MTRDQNTLSIPLVSNTFILLMGKIEYSISIGWTNNNVSVLSEFHRRSSIFSLMALRARFSNSKMLQSKKTKIFFLSIMRKN